MEQHDELKQLFLLIHSKLDPLVTILRNVNTYLTQSVDLTDRQEMIQSTKMIQKKIKSVLDLSKLLDDPHYWTKNHHVFDVLRELTISWDVSVPQRFQMQIPDQLVENQKLLDELNNTMDKDIRILANYDNFNLLSHQIVGEMNLKFIQIDEVVSQLREGMEQNEINFHKSMMYKELSIEALQDQITLYEKRIKRFMKKVPIYQVSDTPQAMQIINLYKVLIQLEDETFKIHQNYQSRIDTYTKDNTELRQKVNKLEKIVNALSQSQNDNHHIITKMKIQGERIAELQFQNDQMREVLLNRSMLEKRIKDIQSMEQKQRDQKVKDEKEQKRLQEARLKEEKDLVKREELKAKEQKSQK